MATEIKLILKGDQIAPEDSPHTSNNKTTLRQGESIRFMLGPEFKSGDAITFDNASPLTDGAIKVGYNVPLDIAVDATPGTYSYSCAATGLDGKPRHSPGGGEMII